MSRTVDSVLRASPARPVSGQLSLWTDDEPDPATPEEPTESTNSTERTTEQ
jgi:hypothetical protein